MEHFGCCHNYVECSDQLRCMWVGNPNFAGCAYRVHLESGRIFYGKNRNIDKKVTTEQLSNQSFENVYLYCWERVFNIGIIDKNKHTYCLNSHEVEEVISAFETHEIPYKTECSPEYCFIDRPEPWEPEEADSRVEVALNGQMYRILNFNYWLIKKKNAEKIAKAFEAKGISARVETFTNFQGQRSERKKMNMPEPKSEGSHNGIEVNEEQSEKKMKYYQQSIFDIVKVTKLYGVD